ncbi:MAG TPA: DUF4159 domain-containing protein, partial [Tepidisphaeraceae bacterium]
RRPATTQPAPHVPATTQADRISPRGITLDQIDAAISRAVAALEKMQPPDADLGQFSYAAAGLPYGVSDLIMPGQQALADWAMLASGESFQSPWMQKRINWVACFDSPETYDRAMRLQALACLPPREWQPWVKRDADWLISSITDQGNFTAEWLGGPSAGFGDNANGQYGVLGLWAAHRCGYPIDDKVWKAVDSYWRSAQQPSVDEPAQGAGWAVNSFKNVKPGEQNAFGNRVSAPMTAGGVLTLSLTERFLEGPKRVDVGASFSPEMLKGLRWLDKHFSFADVEGDSDFYYYIWTIQNVGQASGYRTFNKVDWFREATARLLNDQLPDGLWKGPKGPIVSTSFALLYLARARGPLAVCKVRFEPAADPKKHRAPGAGGPGGAEGAAWNNRPNDLLNFTDFVSNALEVPTSWQIADLDQPVYELIESQMLYLATHRPFALTDEQIARLREYINAGGLLVLAPEGSNLNAPLGSMRELAAKLYPGRELGKIDPKHPFYDLFAKVKGNIAISTVDNGIRPLVVIVERDIGRELQMDRDNQRDAMNLMANLYLYASGRDAKRPRIVTHYVTQEVQNPTPSTRPAQPALARGARKIAAARIRYDGNFDPEPLALPQLKALLANNHDVDLQLSTVSAEELKDQKLAFLAITEGATFDDKSLAALRKWMDAGGTLWVDAAGGLPPAVTQLRTFVDQLGFKAPDLKELSRDDPLLSGKVNVGGRGDRGYDISAPTYRRFTSTTADPRPSVQVARIQGRPALYVSRGDLTAAWAGVTDWNIAGLTPTSARHLVLNGILSLLPQPPSTLPATRPTTNKTSSTAPTTAPSTSSPVAPAPVTRD